MSWRYRARHPWQNWDRSMWGQWCWKERQSPNEIGVYWRLMGVPGITVREKRMTFGNLVVTLPCLKFLCGSKRPIGLRALSEATAHGILPKKRVFWKRWNAFPGLLLMAVGASALMELPRSCEYWKGNCEKRWLILIDGSDAINHDFDGCAYMVCDRASRNMQQWNQEILDVGRSFDGGLNFLSCVSSVMDHSVMMNVPDQIPRQCKHTLQRLLNHHCQSWIELDRQGQVSQRAVRAAVSKSRRVWECVASRIAKASPRLTACVRLLRSSTLWTATLLVHTSLIDWLSSVGTVATLPTTTPHEFRLTFSLRRATAWLQHTTASFQERFICDIFAFCPCMLRRSFTLRKVESFNHMCNMRMNRRLAMVAEPHRGGQDRAAIDLEALEETSITSGASSRNQPWWLQACKVLAPTTSFSSPTRQPSRTLTILRDGPIWPLAFSTTSSIPTSCARTTMWSSTRTSATCVQVPGDPGELARLVATATAAAAQAAEPAAGAAGGKGGANVKNKKEWYPPIPRPAVFATSDREQVSLWRDWFWSSKQYLMVVDGKYEEDMAEVDKPPHTEVDWDLQWIWGLEDVDGKLPTKVPQQDTVYASGFDRLPQLQHEDVRDGSSSATRRTFWSLQEIGWQAHRWNEECYTLQMHPQSWFEFVVECLSCVYIYIGWLERFGSNVFNFNGLKAPKKMTNNDGMMIAKPPQEVMVWWNQNHPKKWC